MLFWATNLVRDLFGRYSRLLERTLVAALRSTSFCPMLACLLIACRMRALNMTNLSGSPQGWAQECMYGIAMGTIVQVVACLALPLFTQDASQVDEGGHV